MDHERSFGTLDPKDIAGGVDKHRRHSAGKDRPKRLKSNGDWGCARILLVWQISYDSSTIKITEGNTWQL